MLLVCKEKLGNLHYIYLTNISSCVVQERCFGVNIIRINYLCHTRVNYIFLSCLYCFNHDDPIRIVNSEVETFGA